MEEKKTAYANLLSADYCGAVSELTAIHSISIMKIE